MTSLQLAKVQFAGTSILSRGYFKELSRQDRLCLLPMTAAGGAVGIGSMVFILLQNYRALFLVGTHTGHPELLYFFSVLVSSLFIFILSIPLALSKIYHSGDAELLISLPVTPLQFVLSKTVLLYGFSLFIHLVFYLPALYVYLGNTSVQAACFFPSLVQAFSAPLPSLGFTAGVAAFCVFLLSRRITAILSKHQESAVTLPRTGKKKPRIRARHPVTALFMKEWSVLSSSSAFIFEAVGEALVLPIVLVMFSLLVPDEVVTLAGDFLEGFGMKGPLVLGLILLFTGINSIPSTSLSREGPGLSLSLSLPVSGKDHLKAPRAFFTWHSLYRPYSSTWPFSFPSWISRRLPCSTSFPAEQRVSC